MSGPPQGGFNGGEMRPVAVQQTTVIQVGSEKSVIGAVVLGLFFGPLGLLYVTVPGALIMLGVSFLIAIFTLGLGLIIVGPICAIWAGIAASSHNKRLQGVASHQAVGAAQGAAAGWYPDPEGGERLRYYDGMGWTAQYAAQTAQADPTPAPEPPAAAQIEEAPTGASDAPRDADESEAEESEADEEVDSEAVTTIAPQQVFCGSCGNGISATARFCSACGEPQATA